MKNILNSVFKTQHQSAPFEQIQTANFIPALELEISKTLEEIDLPHFSVNPTTEGYSSLTESVNENKSHFSTLINSTKSGGYKTSSLKDKSGKIIGVRFERGTNSSQSQQDFNKLINELISNAQ
ncbi:hypothetical protein OAC88_00505 [Flavobacteriaceae bacterium]|nr:hypothetical protein [Flavobacteriaceae bacterium]